MPVQRPPAITRRLVEQEPDEILLPVVSSSSAASQRVPASELPVPEKLPKRYVASPAPLLLPMVQRSVGLQTILPSPLTQGEFLAPLLSPELTLHKQITLPPHEAVYIPGKRQLHKRIVPILLLVSCLLFLLATSLLAFLLLVERPGASIHPAMKVDHTRGQQGQSTSPKLQLSASQIDFGAVSAQNTITLTNAGGEQIDWKAWVDSNSSWLSIKPTHGTFSRKVTATLTANRSNLAPRAYTGYITFYQQGTYKSLTLKVTMTVIPTAATVTIPPPATVTVGPLPVPAMVITPNTLAFSTIQGTNPSPQTFTITNTGNAPLNWAITEDTNAATFAPVSSTHRTVAPGNSVAITVTPKVAQAAAGVIDGTITIVDTDKGTPVQSQQVAVKITISNQAVISVSSANLTFNSTSTTESPPQLLTITNTGSALLNWTLSQPLPSWLSVDIPGGILSPKASAFVNVASNSAGLRAGTYRYTLVVSDTDANTPVTPQSIQVTLTVT